MSSSSPLTLRLQFQTSLLGLNRLIKHVGLGQALAIGFKLTLQQLRGEPFKQLEKAASIREKLSRKQIAPAILLYRELRKNYDETKALTICQDIVVDGTLLFLNQAIGPIKKEAIKQMKPAQRTRWITNIADKFFNATINWHSIGATEISFTVTQCQFPQLCQKVGAPELAPLFCVGDHHFFNQPEHFVQLSRSQTIAEGASNCPFNLSEKQSEPKPILTEE